MKANQQNKIYKKKNRDDNLNKNHICKERKDFNKK